MENRSTNTRNILLRDLDSSFKSIRDLISKALVSPENQSHPVQSNPGQSRGSDTSTIDRVDPEKSRNGSGETGVCKNLWANIRSFTGSIADPILRNISQPPKKPTEPPIQNISPLNQANPKSNAQRKLAQIRENRRKGIVTCYRCGEKNQLSNACQNAVVCFDCGRLGHRSTNYRAIILKPPLPTNTAKPSPQSIARNIIVLQPASQPIRAPIKQKTANYQGKNMMDKINEQWRI
jgi:hypothetical protein